MKRNEQSSMTIEFKPEIFNEFDEGETIHLKSIHPSKY